MNMKKVLSRLLPVRIKYLRNWIVLTWQSFLLSLQIWPKENQFAVGVMAGVASVFASFLVMFFCFWVASPPEVYRSWNASIHGETVIVSVVARDGRELPPDSPEAQKILKGPHEVVWVD